MKKLILLLGLVSVLQTLVHAQDEALFMHYNISPILINPAAAGFDETYNLQFNARMQWTGFEDAPKTFAARYNGPLGRTFGLGIGIFSETAAQMSRSKLQLDYAFRYPVNDDWKLAFGFFTEFQQMRIDGDITASPFYDPADALLEDLLNGKGQFDAALGIYGTFRENTYGGITFNNLVSSRLSEIAGVGASESFFSYYTFNVGHRFELTQQKVSLEPSILLRQIRNAPFQMDLNLKAGFLDEQLIAGLSYRAGLGAMGILLGTRLTNFNLYYSYDVSFQRFQKYNTGSHEITVALTFKKRDKKKNQ
ncbi:PorP/SprF family type IX secretion system membrane protein [Lewinella cohaerens]|uniref:PorP/SprF family type IX secretion system membrane protein n=1 Tax=Lewinella cohaerens TaxID=70995 RepID=UPI000366CC04|nr:PorP/SprF family type IX secretion system membrane protein [Lewinella cohaerens]